MHVTHRFNLMHNSGTCFLSSFIAWPGIFKVNFQGASVFFCLGRDYIILLGSWVCGKDRIRNFWASGSAVLDDAAIS